MQYKVCFEKNMALPGKFSVKPVIKSTRQLGLTGEGSWLEISLNTILSQRVR